MLEGRGLIVVEGVRQDLRVQSYHYFYFFEIQMKF